MKSILMTTSAVLLVTGIAAGQALAACPEDIDAFTREYDQTLQNTQPGQALTASEQSQLYGLRIAAESLYDAGNTEMCNKVIQRANLTLESAVAPKVIKADDLVGLKVTNGAEDDVGDIESVMLDPVSGRIAYVVLEHGGFLGIGDDLFAVPWGAVKFVPGETQDEQKLILDIPEERLENAPRFSRKDETPLERREWVTSVHNYYGVEPYWQDAVSRAAMQYGGGTAGPAPTDTTAPSTTAPSTTAPTTPTPTTSANEGTTGGTTGNDTGATTAPATPAPATPAPSAPAATMPAPAGADKGAGQGAAPSQSGTAATQSGAAEPQSGSDVVVLAPVPAPEGKSGAATSQPATGGQAGTEGQPVAAAPATQTDQQKAQSDSASATETKPENASGTQSEAKSEPVPSTALLARQPDLSGSGSTQGSEETQASAQPSAETASAPSQEIETLIDRVDHLQQRIEELSQSGVDEVKKSVSTLEQQVQELSQQGPSEEITKAISKLENEVQQLSDQTVGDEIRQKLASIEQRLDKALGASGSEGTGGQSAAVSGQPAADQTTQSGQKTQSDENTQSGQNSQSGQESQPAQQPEAQPQSGEQGAAEPQSGQQGSGQHAATPQADQKQADQKQADQKQADQKQASAPPSSGENSSGGSQATGEATGQATGQAKTDQKEVVMQETTVAPAASAGGTEAQSGEPCGDQLTQLEDDLESAEKLGMAIGDARSELKEARAMLNNNSEALCRAAIKRAHEDLVAVGYEPTQTN